jgi:16S rRNA (guanine1207-N2)-methyltransferase
VIDDTSGALSLGSHLLGASRVRVHQDSVVSRHTLELNRVTLLPDAAIEHVPLEDAVTQDALLALVRLPRSLDRLDDIAGALAANMNPEAVVIAGNMHKHMTPAQNEVLRKHFGGVDVSLARGKARLLTASGPRRAARRQAVRVRLDEPTLAAPFDVVALPGVFAGASLDRGTRRLLEAATELTSYSVAIDLACGSGIVASWLARRQPAAQVIATDVSQIAVESAHRTAEANGVRVDAVLDDGLSTQPPRSADLVMLNPPFHVGAAVNSAVAHHLFAEAARTLRPGGQLLCVWNAHLGYRTALNRVIGPTRQLTRDATFIVTESIRRSL